MILKKYILFFVIVPVWASAQNRQIVDATMGEDLSGKVSDQMKYLFPEFTTGDVYYFDIPKSKGKLNYNMLLGEMQFLENDQIFTLANVNNVDFVNIENRKFYRFNDMEFVEELMSTGTTQLRVRRKGNAVPHSKRGGYGTESSTEAISSYTGISSSDSYFNLSVKGKVLISIDYYYYLIGANGRYVLIKNVKTFTRQFPSYRTQIKVFVKEHNTRFNNEDDLKVLLEYCSKF